MIDPKAIPYPYQIYQDVSVLFDVLHCYWMGRICVYRQIFPWPMVIDFICMNNLNASKSPWVLFKTHLVRSGQSLTRQTWNKGWTEWQTFQTKAIKIDGRRKGAVKVKRRDFCQAVSTSPTKTTCHIFVSSASCRGGVWCCRYTALI